MYVFTHVRFHTISRVLSKVCHGGSSVGTLSQALTLTTNLFRLILTNLQTSLTNILKNLKNIQKNSEKEKNLKIFLSEYAKNFPTLVTYESSVLNFGES